MLAASLARSNEATVNVTGAASYRVLVGRTQLVRAALVHDLLLKSFLVLMNAENTRLDCSIISGLSITPFRVLCRILEAAGITGS